MTRQRGVGGGWIPAGGGSSVDGAAAGRDRTPADPTGRRPRRDLLRSLAAVAAVAPLAGCTATLRGKREQQLLSRYDAGLAAYRDGIERYNEGVIAYRSDEYEQAVRTLEAAEAALADATSEFRAAEALAREIDNQRAAGICASAATTTERLRRAAAELAASSAGFDDGDNRSAQRHYDRYRELQRTRSESTVANREAVVDAVDEGFLGL